jgi:Xaa-Pro dipeptidase
MTANDAQFSMGPGTHAVPMSMHRDHRRALAERLRRHGVPEGAVVLLQGGQQPQEYDTDRELLFYQESFFQYLFGLKEPGFLGALEVGSGRATLFMPRLPESYAVWMGRIQPPEHFREHYAVDEVRYADEIAAVLQTMKPAVLLLLEGVNTDSGNSAQPASFDGIGAFKTDRKTLYPHIVECRVRKSPEEMKLLAWVNAVSSAAHVEVMRRCRPGLMEYQAEALFLHEVYDKAGCRFTAYTCICGCGPHSAVLHYGHQGAPNDGPMRDGDLFLNDSGAEYHGYSADITCTYPVNGRFTWIVLPPSLPYSGPRHFDQQSSSMCFLTSSRFLASGAGKSFGADFVVHAFAHAMGYAELGDRVGRARHVRLCDIVLVPGHSLSRHSCSPH